MAWLLKEQFAAIYEAPDRAEAERRLEVWIDHIIETDLPELINIWRTLQWWVEPILAYFDDRVTNAFAEGMTNKIKSDEAPLLRLQGPRALPSQGLAQLSSSVEPAWLTPVFREVPNF